MKTKIKIGRMFWGNFYTCSRSHLVFSSGRYTRTRACDGKAFLIPISDYPEKARCKKCVGLLS